MKEHIDIAIDNHLAKEQDNEPKNYDRLYELIDKLTECEAMHDNVMSYFKEEIDYCGIDMKMTRIRDDYFDVIKNVSDLIG